MSASRVAYVVGDEVSRIILIVTGEFSNNADQQGYGNKNVQLFLGVVVELRKATISWSCMSVRLSVRIEQLGSHWMDLH
jgi:hypothetical protein